MIKPFIDAVIQFAEHEPVIESVILVGSYARGTNTKHSDIDLCIITTDKKRMTEHPDFIHQFGTVIKKTSGILRRMHFHSRMVRKRNGSRIRHCGTVMDTPALG